MRAAVGIAHAIDLSGQVWDRCEQELLPIGGDFNLSDGTVQIREKPASTLEERISLLALECGLTERESEVLAALVLTEKKNQQIADDPHISRRQLQTHISHVYKKTGVTTRAGLAMRANVVESAPPATPT